MSGVKSYLSAVFSINEDRGWHSRFTELQGYAYAAFAVLFFFAPSMVRTFFFLLEDTNILSDSALRCFFMLVFLIGSYYIVCGREGSRAFSLATGLGRPFLIVLPAIALYYAGDMDLGLMLIMVLFDGGFGVLTLVLSALYGVEKPFQR